LLYVKTSVLYVLLFVGGKIPVSNHYSIPTLISLGVILAILSIGVAASLVLSGRAIAPTP
jgi:tellurite resistance protein TerC